jgi:inosine triphosphate pyrophosphatase
MASPPSVPQHLNFITGNANKLAEVQAILSGVIELRSQNVDLVEIQGTVEEVTKDKARRAAEAVSPRFSQTPDELKLVDGGCDC